MEGNYMNWLISPESENLTKREKAMLFCEKAELYSGQVMLLSIKYYTFSPKSDFHNLL